MRIRAWWVLVAAAAVALAVPVAVLLQRSDASTPLERAQGLARNTANFDTGREAGDTLVFAADELLEAARRCIARDGETPYCLTFRSAAAWSNVAGAKALTCRAPGRFALQHTAIDLYRRLAAAGPSLRDIPRLPPLPNCG